MVVSLSRVKSKKIHWPRLELKSGEVDNSSKAGSNSIARLTRSWSIPGCIEWVTS